MKSVVEQGFEMLQSVAIKELQRVKNLTQTWQYDKYIDGPAKSRWAHVNRDL